jgi:hypothetical protein
VSFEAIGIDPEGNHVNLENSGARDERIDVVVRFHESQAVAEHPPALTPLR